MVEISERINLDLFARVVKCQEEVFISKNTVERMLQSKRVVDNCIQRGEAIYGVNTGFGKLARVRLANSQLRELQRNLLISHAAGVGQLLDEEIVRGIIYLRAHILSMGFSGVRPVIVEYLLKFLEEELYPLVPSLGSVGASGDLAPLAHLALSLIGIGKVKLKGDLLDAKKALQSIGLKPLELEPKEGLALVNGTQVMTAIFAISIIELEFLFKVANTVAALSLIAFDGSSKPLDVRIHELKPYVGQIETAKCLKDYVGELKGSRVQDPYSFRCIPQVHGAFREFMIFAKKIVETEMNSVSDNPIVLPQSGEILNGGNFHGEIIALAADSLKNATISMIGISERRVSKLIDSSFSGLSPFLVEDSGVKSGFMIAHVTSSALLNLARSLAFPSSVDSISTSADQEDYVSMGTNSTLLLRRVTNILKEVLAIELLVAIQGIDMRKDSVILPKELAELRCEFRKSVPFWEEKNDVMADLISKSLNFIDNTLRGIL